MVQARQHVRQATSKRSRSGKAAGVPVSKDGFKRIATKKQAHGKLITGYDNTAAKAKRTGRTIMITYVVTPDGKAEAVLEPSADEAVGRPLDAAIARAKARGATKIADILKGPDMLTARDFGPLIGASHETVNAKRKRDEILGLEGATRGLRYPRWQVTDAGLPLPGLAQLFAALGKQHWTVFRFLTTGHAELGGQTALDALKAGQVDAVLGVAQNLAVGAFG